MKKEKKIISFLPVVISFLFLFNPNISFIDPLPDFFGYLLICLTLRKLADMNETLFSAYLNFSRMAVLDAIKLVVTFLVFGLFFGEEQGTMLLLAAFAFGAIELFLLIPAYKHLFSGLLELGFKYDNISIMGKKDENDKKNFTEKAASYTFFFVIFKVIICILPEFSILPTQSYDDTSKFAYLYDFIGLLRGFALVVCLAFGIIWLFKMMKYFARIEKDSILISCLSENYRKDVLPKESIFIQRKIKLSFVFIGAFALLCADFRIDGVNVLPDFFSAIALILAVFSIKKYICGYKKYIVLACCYGALSVVYSFVEIIFFDNYYYGSIARNDEAYSLYLVMLFVSVVKVIFFLVTAFSSIKIFRTIISEYTGFSVKKNPNGENERITALHKELERKLHVLVFGILFAAVGDIFCNFSAHKIGFSMLINNITAVVFFITVCYVTNEIYDEIKSKYMLD